MKRRLNVGFVCFKSHSMTVRTGCWMDALTYRSYFALTSAILIEFCLKCRWSEFCLDIIDGNCQFAINQLCVLI